MGLKKEELMVGVQRILRADAVVSQLSHAPRNEPFISAHGLTAVNHRDPIEDQAAAPVNPTGMTPPGS